MRHLGSIGILCFAFTLTVGCATDTPPADAPPAPVVDPAPPPVPEEASVLRTTLSASGASPTSLTLRVENPTDAPAEFSRVHTPFEGITNGFLTVLEADGSEVPYQGPMVKRGPPGPEDEVVVAPGAATEVTFDLVPSWPVVSGAYTVQFTGGSISRLPPSDPIPLVVP